MISTVYRRQRDRQPAERRHARGRIVRRRALKRAAPLALAIEIAVVSVVTTLPYWSSILTMIVEIVCPAIVPAALW